MECHDETHLRHGKRRVAAQSDAGSTIAEATQEETMLFIGKV